MTTQISTHALRLVPVEPTEAMLNAAIEAFPRSHPSVFPIIYRYMVEAAPASPRPEGGGQCSGITGELKSPDLDALEKLVAGLVGFAVHDDDCTVNRFPGADACSCGLRPILQQSRAFLARNGKGEGQ